MPACHPVIGSLPVHAVTQADVLKELAPIWTEKPDRRGGCARGFARCWIGRAAGYREGVSPVEGVEKGLPKQRAKAQHFSALASQDLPDLMHRIEAMDGMGALALRFAILTAARSGEVRGAAWDDVDLEGRVWTVPAERMKAGEAQGCL